VSAVNPKVIQELRDIGGPSFLAELIDLFISEGTGHVARIRESFDARDAQLLERSAHTLKGSAGNLGAQALSRLCADLQTAAKGGDWDRAAELIAPIEGEFAAARAELEAAKAAG
jgi:HPt (histidine-containing phosphotransfer) domain-containing protein